MDEQTGCGRAGRMALIAVCITRGHEHSRGKGHAAANWVGAEGPTATRARDLVRSADRLTVERTLTGPNGRTYNSTRTCERPAGD